MRTHCSDTERVPTHLLSLPWFHFAIQRQDYWWWWRPPLCRGRFPFWFCHFSLISSSVVVILSFPSLLLVTLSSSSSMSSFSSECVNAFALVVRPPTEHENLLFSFQLTGEETVKSVWLRMLCRHVANTICRADAVRIKHTQPWLRGREVAP